MKRSRRRHLIAVLIALCAAALACGGSPSVAPTRSANFTTVTPGGRISVSLLTPTIPVEGTVEQAGTPIGAVATATAQAALQTQVPTPTVAGVYTDPARCPEGGNPTLPAQSPGFNRYAETLASFLSSGGAPTVVEARLRAWGALAEYGGLVRADRDFTADGVPEVLVVALDPRQPNFPYPGDLFIFGCEAGAYRLLHQAGSTQNRSAPLVFSADDLNGDSINDLVYVTQDCEAEGVCYADVHIIGWNLSLGSFVDMAQTSVHAPGAEVSLANNDGDSVIEVVVTSGVVGSASAGPQRVTTTTLRWNGAEFAIASVDMAPARYRIHVIHEADAAFESGDFPRAVDLYWRAANDDGLQSWTYPEEAQHLQAYALFRTMLTHAANGDPGNAQNAFNELQGRFAPPPPPPPPTDSGDSGDSGDEGGFPTPVPAARAGDQFLEMARIFWQAYSESGWNLDVACRATVSYARSVPTSFEVLNSFGYANPTYTASDLCPIGP